MTDTELTHIGRYEIKSELGRGSIAVAYRGYDPASQREVAVKILPRGLLLDPTFAAFFNKTAERIASTNHPALVPLFEYGNDNDQLFLVYPLMPGGALHSRLSSGPLPPAQCAALIARIAPGIDAAHQKGVIHRSLYPKNILFDDQDLPCISDFGLVSLMMQSTETVTTSGAIYGDPAYWSPEQALGITLDNRTDIYSLGAMIFEMLTGQLPYERQKSPILMARSHVIELVPNILKTRPGLPAGCKTVIERAMAKKSAERAPTAGEVAAMLSDAVRAQ